MISRALFLLFPLVLAATARGADLPTDFLPPAPPWSGASEQLIVDAKHPWITPGEKTGLTDSPSYEETIAWLSRLADAWRSCCAARARRSTSTCT